MRKKSQVKLLNKAYYKSLKNLNKNFFNNKNTGLFLFIEYLKYIRDSLIIEDSNAEQDQEKLATIITAIAEFEAYTSCRDTTNKTFHWANFCELVKQNLREWIDDSI